MRQGEDGNETKPTQENENRRDAMRRATRRASLCSAHPAYLAHLDATNSVGPQNVSRRNLSKSQNVPSATQTTEDSELLEVEVRAHRRRIRRRRYRACCDCDPGRRRPFCHDPLEPGARGGPG